MKKHLPCLCLLLTFSSSVIFAESCPSVAAIKAGQAKSWKAYDSDDGQRLSSQGESAFIKHAEAFVLAEWTKSKQGSAIHCYYRNKTGGTIEAYLAKNNFEPVKHHAWYEVTGAMHCAQSSDQCKFQQALLPQQHLAARR